MTTTEFLELRKLISVAHHVPGRIRLKIDPLILAHPAARTLSGMSGGKPEAGLISARVNILARSLVLEYNTERVHPEDLEDFLTSPDVDRLLPQTQKVAALLGIQLQQG